MVRTPRRASALVTAALAGSLFAMAGCAGPPAASSNEAVAPVGDAASAEVAAAQAVVAQYSTPPTAINQTVPLTRQVEQGRTFVVIGCELPQCKTISDGAIAAAEAIGWKTQYLSYQTTDGATLTSAMKDALNYDPIAVAPIGFSQSVWTQLQPDYAAAGVSITPIAVGDVEPSAVVTEGSSSGSDYAKSGEILANWVVADSGAAGKVLVQDVPAFAVLKAYGDSVKSTLASACTGCEVTSLDVAPAQLATNGLVPAVVSELQKDPSIKYVVSTDGAFLAGLPSALGAAGITGVKIAGGAPDINNMEALVAGANAAWTQEPTDQFGWVGVDIAARKSLGMDIAPAGGGRPQLLTTAANVGTPSNTLPYPADYQQQFKTLWGVR